MESDTSRPVAHAFQNAGFSGYKLYFAGRSEFAVLVTNFILQKVKLPSPFSRFSVNRGYKLYFAITLIVLGK